MESNTNVTVNENAGEVPFMLEVIADTLLYTVGVEVRTTAISASDGFDYTLIQQTLFFDNTHRKQIFNVNIVDDGKQRDFLCGHYHTARVHECATGYRCD